MTVTNFGQLDNPTKNTYKYNRYTMHSLRKNYLKIIHNKGSNVALSQKREKGYKIKEFPAKWGQYGKRAGYLRNEEMANYATHCICFWDGESKGTKHMIDIAEREKLERNDIALIRVEQLFPLHQKKLESIIDKYKNVNDYV